MEFRCAVLAAVSLFFLRNGHVFAMEDEEELLKNLTEIFSPLNEKSADSTDTKLTLPTLRKTDMQELFKMATVLPVGYFEFLRKLAVPAMNASLSLPVKLFETISNSSFDEAQSRVVDATKETFARITPEALGAQITKISEVVNEKKKEVGESNFLSPIAIFVRPNNTNSSLPEALNPVKLKRYFYSFKRFLDARGNSTSEQE